MSKELKGENLRSAFNAYYRWSVQKNHRKATTDEVRWFNNRFLSFIGEKPLSKEIVQEYFDTLLYCGVGGKKWQLSSVKNEFKTIRKISRWLVDKKHFDIAFNREDFDFPLEDDDTEFDLLELPSMVIAQEIVLQGTLPRNHKLHTQQRAEMRDALNFMLRTGIRIKELCELRGADLRLNAEVPAYYIPGDVSKNRKGATLPLPREEAFLAMLRGREKNERLFSVNKKRMNDALRRGCKNYGWTGKIITNHSLRHIFACNCAKNGMPIEELSRLMRHSSIEITNAYYLHYRVSELSGSLHRYHDLMKGCQSVEEAFELAKECFEKSGITRDERFVYRSELLQNRLVLSIELA